MLCRLDRKAGLHQTRLSGLGKMCEIAKYQCPQSASSKKYIWKARQRDIVTEIRGLGKPDCWAVEPATCICWDGRRCKYTDGCVETDVA